MTSKAQANPHFPLRGLRVVEVGDFIAAPFCARLLGDAGAEVVKVEPPDGDSARREGPFLEDVPGPGRSALFAYVNRGKRSVKLDPKSNHGRNLILDLVGQADILIHDFPSLANSPLGVHRDELESGNPSLIITSITPFGESGCNSHYKADDLITVSASGLASATPGLPDHVLDPETEPPLRPNAYIAEFVGGLMGAIGTMFALLGRQLTGYGDCVEVSKQEALAFMLVREIGNYSYGNAVVGRHPFNATLAPNHYMPCADGWVAIPAHYEKHWNSLVSLMGNPDWAKDPHFATAAARGDHWEEMEPLLLSWLLDQPGSELFERAQGVGIPICPSLDMSEALGNAHIRSREYLVPTGITGDDRGELPGDPYRADGERRPTEVLAPLLGQHTHQVMSSWLGIEDDENDKLTSGG